jgi:putative flavoprotein involved in K+ transport
MTDASPSLRGGRHDARQEAADWVARFDAALAAGDPAGVADLFVRDSWWRDLLALTWDLRTCSGAGVIGGRLAAAAAESGARGFTLAPRGASERGFFVEFATAAGRGVGFVRLKDGRAWTVLTALDSLTGRPEATGPRRPVGDEAPGVTWPQRRAREAEFLDGDPAVLVVGAGQCGLALAARLGRLGVPTLLVERNARVGDNWRGRYASLVLHDPVWFDHMPYLPFPPSWPVFAPKDKLADWLESYAAALELNVWCSSRILAAAWDEGAARWTVRVGRADGTERELRPAHLVLATGLNGVPVAPQLPGAESFGGTVCHSSAFVGAQGWAGRRAVVVGTGSSAHDIAEELFHAGADVTMLQRSPSYVLSRDNATKVLFAGLYEEGGPPTADADLMAVSMPWPLATVLRRRTTEVLAKLDADLLAGLESAGFGLDFGPDGGGILALVLSRGGGYYIDTGASRLIAERRIALRRGAASSLTPGGLRLADGSELPADLVVLATGYRSMRSAARAILGDAVAERCGPAWGLDGEGEIQGMWRRTGQPGLWLMGGNLQMGRIFSSYVALQIAAFEDGLLHW